MVTTTHNITWEQGYINTSCLDISSFLIKINHNDNKIYCTFFWIFS